MALSLPNDFVNGQVADAVPVQNNYELIESYINAEVITRDGLTEMQAPLTLVGNPTQDNHAANKDYVDHHMAPIGTIMLWPSKDTPSDTSWLICDGRSLEVASFTELHNLIGTTYGGGVGTFLLPNMKGRFPVGLDGGANFTTVGKTGGTFTVPVPAHVHPMPHTHEHPHTHTIAHTHTVDPAQVNTSDTTVALTVTTAVRSSNNPGGTNSFVNAGNDGTSAVINANPTVTSAPHHHTVNVASTTTSASSAASSGQPSDATTGASSATSTSSTGTAGATMIQPYLTLNYIIRVK